MAYRPRRSPVVSAVLCTRDRADVLARTLASLRAQTLARDAFEVVVVDDGSTDGTREVALAFARELPLRCSHQRQAGVASARNHGLFLARGALVLFLDDDVAEPALLEEHVEMHRRFPEPPFAVRGRARLDPSLATDPLMRLVVDDERPSPAGRGPEAFPVLDAGHFRAGRSSCKRSFLVERGVFDPAFRFTGEDVELAQRLSPHGLRVVLAERAVTTLIRSTSVDERCLVSRRQGEARYLRTRLEGASHDTAATELAHAEARWRELRPAYDAIVRSARTLDRIVRVRREEGLEVGAADLSLLDRSYRAAFGASEVKGFVEAAIERGDVTPRDAIA